MTHPTTVRFDEAEYQQLRQLAEQQGTTVSELIRSAVRRSYLDEQREESVSELLAYIDDNPVAVEADPDELDEQIQEAMGDAAVR